jgi:hypothetical protein
LSHVHEDKISDWQLIWLQSKANRCFYQWHDSQPRANEIVELGLREPDGILRQPKRAFTSCSVGEPDDSSSGAAPPLPLSAETKGLESKTWIIRTGLRLF